MEVYDPNKRSHRVVSNFRTRQEYIVRGIIIGAAGTLFIIAIFGSLLG